MKDVVADRRIRVVGSISVIMLAWAAFVVPGGAPWTGIAWLGALALLFVATAILVFGMARSPAMAPVVAGVETEPKAVTARPRH